jgi:hypothetical protein
VPSKKCFVEKVLGRKYRGAIPFTVNAGVEIVIRQYTAAIINVV